MKMHGLLPTWASAFMIFSVVSVKGGEQGKTLLSLGDSLASGQVAFGELFSDGFVGTLYNYLEANYTFDTIVNGACPSETTANFLVAYDEAYNYTECYDSTREHPPSLCYSGLCDPSLVAKGIEGDSQMDAAEKYMMEHPGEVGLIVISLGANDLGICNAENGATCVPAVFQEVSTNMAEILTRLQMAAPGVPIVGLAYHNPFVALYLPGGDAAFAQQYELVFGAAASLLADIFEMFGGHLADVYGAINGYDTSGEPRADVINICQYTGMCTEVDGEYSLNLPFDRHPNELGYEEMGMAFVEVVESEGLLLEDSGSESPVAAPTVATPTGESPTQIPASSDSPTIGSGAFSRTSSMFMGLAAVISGSLFLTL